MPLPTLTRPLLILAALLVVAGLAAGVSAFVATTVSGQTTGYGVLPLRFRKAHQGAGIETDSLIGERCKTVQRQYTTDDPPNQASGEWGPANSSLGDPLSTGLPADRGDSNPDAVLERWVDLGAGNLRLMIECSYPDLFNQPNDRRIRHYLYATTQADAAAAPTAAEIKTALTGNNGIESANVVNNTLTGDDVHDQTLTADDFADESVDGRVVKHRSLPATVLVEDSITSNEMGPGAVGTSELANHVVTADKLSQSVLDDAKVRQWQYVGWAGFHQYGQGNTNDFWAGRPIGSDTSNPIIWPTGLNANPDRVDVIIPTPKDQTTGMLIDIRTAPWAPQVLQQPTETDAKRGTRIKAFYVPWPLPSSCGSRCVTTYTYGTATGTMTVSANSDSPPKLRFTLSSLSGGLSAELAFHVWAERLASYP